MAVLCKAREIVASYARFTSTSSNSARDSRKIQLTQPPPLDAAADRQLAAPEWQHDQGTTQSNTPVTLRSMI
jgi:hypothetical protein